MMATQSTNSAFQSILADCIDYAEFRIYRRLDLLNTRYRDQTAKCTQGSREVTLPSTVLVVESLAVIKPAGSTTPAGVRALLTPTTHEFIDAVYPGDGTSYQGTPEYFAMVAQAQAVVGPAPDGDYYVEVFGVYRPLPLSSTNTTTVLTDLLPDLFLAASMVFMAGYQKNFGAQADDPRMAVSWEAQFQELMKWAESEEFRKKFAASSWTSRIASPEASNQRG